MKAYVITLIGLPLSETRAARCIQSATRFGISVDRQPAVNRFQARSEMTKLGLNLNKRIYKDISDAPIGDRGQVPRGKWRLTTPELGCFLSHFSLWQKCVSLDETILILEHDAVFVAPVPDMPIDALALNLHQSENASAVAYLLTPEAAHLAIDEAKRNGIQPSDEILWRAALRSLPTVVSQYPVVLHDDKGISTIQFTRNDETHKNTSGTNPWREYPGNEAAQMETETPKSGLFGFLRRK